MIRLTIILLVTSFTKVLSQTLPSAASSFGFDTLSIEHQVDQINARFYEIYSQNLETAIELSQYAIETSKSNGWKEKEAFSLMSYGIATYLRGSHDQAIEALLNSSKIFDSLDHSLGISKINNQLAVFYRKQDDIGNMINCLDKGEKAALKANSMDDLGTNYHHRGVMLSQQGKFDDALPYFQKVLNIRLQANDSVGIGYIYLDFAAYEVSKNNITRALEYINQSSEIRRHLGDFQGVAVNEVVMGETLFEAGDYENAIIHFTKASQLGQSMHFIDLTSYAYEMLQKASLNMGDYESAYHNLQKSLTLNDSIFNIQKTKSIQELQVKYETEKKEQQIALQQAQLKSNQFLTLGLAGVIILIVVIALLQRNRMILKQQTVVQQERTKTREAQVEAALNSQEAERKRFARDLHDGFGQMISVLNLNLKSLETNQSSKEEVFENSSKILDEMYRELKGICFNLMPETLIKRGIVDAIKEFSSRINNTGKIRIEVDTFGIEDRLSDLQEISIYRITQEWVNNVLKYSDADMLTISLTKDQEEITLLIEDNGSGFDKSKLTEGSGNGWKNMNSRANLMRGELELDTSPDIKGNALIINAPVLLQADRKKFEKV